jgi:type IV pilus assembly protein PilC
MARGWPLLLLATAGALILARWALQKPRVHAAMDAFLWEMPGWQRVIRQLAWARFAQVLGMLYRHGADILQCLQLACGAAGTTVIRNKTAFVVGRVGRATPLGEALREAGVFPQRLITIAELGEQHGTLDRMLVDLAGQYTDDVELILEQLPQLIQPITIVFVGSLVGTFLLALYYPMFHLYNIIMK